MAHLHRLVLLFVCALFWSGAANADIPVGPGSWRGGDPAGSCTGSLSPALAACILGKFNSRPASDFDQCTFIDVTATSATARCHYIPNNNTLSNGNAQAVAGSCPANSTPSGSACKCAVGYVEFGGTSCVIDNGCLSVMGLTPPDGGACQGGECEYFYKITPGAQATASAYGRFCNSGCTVKGDLASCGQTSGVMISGKGVCVITGSFYTGDKCVGSSEVSGPSSQGTDGGTTTDPGTVKTDANGVPDKAASDGKCPGQVNGVDVMVTCGSSASNDTSTKNGTTKNPDGSVTNNTTNNTTTTQTICNGNSCQKITTTTSGGSGPNGTGPGSKTETTTETGTKDSMCASNPGSNACKGNDDKKPTGFGGTCAGGYKAVSEDAVINAMAEETFRQNCKVNPDDASQTLGREEAAKTGNQTGSNPNNSTVSIGSGSFDTSNALGGVASCIADKTIVVMGRSINIAFSMICQYLEALGLVMVGVASLLSLRIVTRG
jgi:hypothetical protein